MCGSMMGSMGMPGPAWALPGLALTVLLAVAVATALFLAVTRSRTPIRAAGPTPASGPVALTKERYARGDIDHAAFERILDDLLRAEGRDSGGS